MIAKDSENLPRAQRNDIPGLGIELPRLLVIVWESDIRDGIGGAASNSGYQVVSCPSANEAVKLCEVNRFDAIIVDSALYGMDCVEFLRWVRQDGECSESYVLAVTQSTSPGETRALLSAGADDCLPKPVAPETLAHRLVVMEHHRRSKAGQMQEFATLKKNHSRFESIFMESPDAILILKNREGKIIGVNRAVKTVLGFEGKALLGKYLSLVFPELFDAEGLSSFGSFLKNASSVQSVHFRSPDGRRKVLDLGLTSIPWERGFALMLTCRDCSDREGNASLQNGSEKVEAIRRFASGVSGDFNDLMTSVSGNLELLENQPFATQESLDLLSRARQACERVRELTAEMNAIAGVIGMPRRQRIPVRSLIEKTVQFGLFGESRMRPLFRFQDGVGDVFGDERQLRLVVEQLTANAAESMRSKNATAGRLHVDCSNVRVAKGGPQGLRPGEYVRVLFRDEGEGIPEEHRERVFDPYFTTRRSGRGMGLARVRAIVHAFGGRITAETQTGSGGGAVFEMYLPAAGAGDSAASLPSTKANGKGGAAPAGTGKRILFLDDEPNIRLVVERALEGHGYEVYCAATGEEAIKAFKRGIDFGKPFDVLLLDLEIRGGMGGRDTLGIIRQEHPNVRAIVTTGFIDDNVLANHRDFGFCGVLAKPFRVEQLVSCVGQLCNAGSR